jgi:hypothetical protein
MNTQKERGNWQAKWKIEKFASEEAKRKGEVFEVKEFAPNLLVNGGINALFTLLAGGGGTGFDNANSYIGVGDSNTAESASQTDLQASTNKLRKGMNSGYPTYGTNQKMVFQADFGSSDANYDWNEFAVFNASTGGTMLNRKVSSQGTKASGQTWTLTLEITLS